MNPTPLLDRIRIVLCRPSHPGNIGAVARAMKTMGLSSLYLVNPKEFPHEEATSRASGASDVLTAATVCSSLDAALQGTVCAAALSARSRDLGPEPLQARHGALELIRLAGEISSEQGIALVFGNETSGLSNEELQRCQLAISIPANPAYSSLNLGAAVQLLCYELRMAAFADAPPRIGLATPATSPLASHEEMEGFYGHLAQVMVTSGFLDPTRPKRLLPKLRRLFSRARVEKEEVNILRGILSAVSNHLPSTK